MDKRRADVLDADDGSSATTDTEEYADRFARDLLIDPKAYADFIEGLINGATVRDFARRQGISPGIVVGRWQPDGALAPRKLNHLKRRLEWTSARPRRGTGDAVCLR